MPRNPREDVSKSYLRRPAGIPVFGEPRQFFENGATAFERKTKAAESEYQRTIDAKRDKLVRKDEVVSELMEEHVRQKKGLGGF
jgi:hypothetical protein